MRFKRAIGVMERFRIQTQVIGTTNNKWVWVEHRFQTYQTVRPQQQQEQQQQQQQQQPRKVWRSVAVGICKVCLMKKGKVVVPTSVIPSLSSLPSSLPAGVLLEECEKEFGKDELAK